MYFILYLPFVLVYFTERWQPIFSTSILRFYSILLFHKSIIIFLSTCWEKSQACRSCMPRAWKSITHFYEENRKGFLPSNIFFSFTVRFSEEVGLPFHLFKPYIFCLATIPFEFCLLNFQHPQNYISKLFSFFGEYTDKLFYNYCC